MGKGPESTGPIAGMGLRLEGETASGSVSSVSDAPLPFFLVVSGVMKSRLAELFMLRNLFLWTSSPVEGAVELMVGGKEEVRWHPPGLRGGG